MAKNSCILQIWAEPEKFVLDTNSPHCFQSELQTNLTLFTITYYLLLLYNQFNICLSINSSKPLNHINQKYKGNINYDFEKHRKNIVISYLYGCCTQHERRQLATTSDFEYLCKLVKKYDVLATLLNELESEIIEIMQQCLYFKNSNLQFYNDFKNFLIVMFNICYKKCELPLKNELFNN